MPLWLALMLMAGGTAVQGKAQTDAARRYMDQQNIGREKEKKVEGQQRDEVLREAESLDPVLRQEALDASAAATEQQISDVLSDNAVDTTGDTGVVSNPVLLQRAQSTRNKANNASILAALMSKTQAPGDVAVDENADILNLIANSKGRTSKLGRNRKTTDTLAQILGIPNSGMMMAGGLMSGVGTMGATSNIMGGLQAPGSEPFISTGGPMQSPVPYAPEDPFGIAGIR